MLIYAGLGDKDRAFEGLAATAEINWWRAATWMHRPEMVLLRDDPRMAALREKLGLPGPRPLISVTDDTTPVRCT